MNTRLTYADVQSALGSLFPPAQFSSLLNRGSERLVNSGKWKGSVIELKFPASTGFITLPPQALGVLMATWNKCPIPTFTQFHEYVETGPGNMDLTRASMGILDDMGDGFATQADIVTPSVVQMFCSSADNGAIVRLNGLDANGNEVTDASGNRGEQLTLNHPSVTSSNVYSVVTDISKPLTLQPLSLWVPASGPALAYQIGAYQTFETNIMYRRYGFGTTVDAIRVLCQRRWFPANVATDWVYPGSLGALQFAMRAVMNEDSGSEAEPLWMKAYAVLNQEEKITRAGARIDAVPEPFGYMNRMPSIN